MMGGMRPPPAPGVATDCTGVVAHLFDVFPLCRGVSQRHAHRVEHQPREAEQLHGRANERRSNHVIHEESPLIGQEDTPVCAELEVTQTQTQRNGQKDGNAG